MDFDENGNPFPIVAYITLEQVLSWASDHSKNVLFYGFAPRTISASHFEEEPHSKWHRTIGFDPNFMVHVSNYLLVTDHEHHVEIVCDTDGLTFRQINMLIATMTNMVYFHDDSVIYSTWDSTVLHVWDIVTGDKSNIDVKLSGSKNMAIQNHRLAFSNNDLIGLFDCVTQKTKWTTRHTLYRYSSRCITIDFSQDGRFIFAAYGHYHCQSKLFSAWDGYILATFDDYPRAIVSIRLSPCARRIYFIDSDDTNCDVLYHDTFSMHKYHAICFQQPKMSKMLFERIRCRLEN